MMKCNSLQGDEGAGELTAEDIEIRIGQAVSEKERIEQAIGTGRDNRVVLAGRLDEGGLQLRKLREETGEAVAA